MADVFPLGLIALGALLALDGTSVGQFMISRPLVAGVLAGWFLGDPMTGLWVGGLLELFYLPTVPSGGGSVPEAGPATVVAVYAGFLGPPGAGLALAVCLGLTWGVLGSLIQEKARSFYVSQLPRQDTPDLVRRVARVQWMGAGVEFIRGALLTALGLLLVHTTGAYAAAVWPMNLLQTVLLLVLAAMLPLGSLLATLGGLRARGGWMAGGLAAGLLGSLL